MKKEKKTKMSEGERNLPVRRRNVTERDAAEREREREWCAERERARACDEGESSCVR